MIETTSSNTQKVAASGLRPQLGVKIALLLFALLAPASANGQAPCPTVRVDAMVIEGVSLVKPNAHNFLALSALRPSDFDCVIRRQFGYTVHDTWPNVGVYHRAFSAKVQVAMFADGTVMFYNGAPDRYDIIGGLLEELLPYRTGVDHVFGHPVYVHRFLRDGFVYEIRVSPEGDAQSVSIRLSRP